MKKCIVIVSFGTSDQETKEKTIDACQRKIANFFPDYSIRSVFTSDRLRKKLDLKSLRENLDELVSESYEEVIIQPLHLIPGKEYLEKIVLVARDYQDKFKDLKVGQAVLTDFRDYKKVIAALEMQFPQKKEDEAIVLMGHGSSHPANASYSCLQLLLFDKMEDVYIATLCAYPFFQDVVSKLKKNKIKKVYLMPLMLVAGIHTQEDMIGADSSSWKNVLEKEGFEVEAYVHGLGENPMFQDIYLSLIRDCQI